MIVSMCILQRRSCEILRAWSEIITIIESGRETGGERGPEGGGAEGEKVPRADL